MEPFAVNLPADRCSNAGVVCDGLAGNVFIFADDVFGNEIIAYTTFEMKFPSGLFPLDAISPPLGGWYADFIVRAHAAEHRPHRFKYRYP